MLEDWSYKVNRQLATWHGFKSVSLNRRQDCCSLDLLPSLVKSSCLTVPAFEITLCKRAFLHKEFVAGVTSTFEMAVFLTMDGKVVQACVTRSQANICPLCCVQLHQLGMKNPFIILLFANFCPQGCSGCKFYCREKPGPECLERGSNLR